MAGARMALMGNPKAHGKTPRLMGKPQGYLRRRVKLTDMRPQLLGLHIETLTLIPSYGRWMEVMATGWK